MIDPKDIRITRRPIERPDGEHDHGIQAELRARVLHLVMREHADPATLAHVEQQAVDSIWRILYGDILPLLHELQTYVMYLGPVDGVHDRARAILQELLGKLARPGARAPFVPAYPIRDLLAPAPFDGPSDG